MKIAIIGTSSQEWDTAGPYLFALLGPCVDPEHGAMVFKMPPFLTVDRRRQVNRNPMMAMAPNLTWINREHDRARYMIGIGMAAEQVPIHADPAAPPVIMDAQAADIQMAPIP